jgi:DNA invertase Pin-like site-specific DNA recombinase
MPFGVLFEYGPTGGLTERGQKVRVGSASFAGHSETGPNGDEGSMSCALGVLSGTRKLARHRLLASSAQCSAKGTHPGFVPIRRLRKEAVLQTNRAGLVYGDSCVAKRHCISGSIGRYICAMQIGYARVSTDDQDTAAQVAALKAAGCERTYREKASGGRWDRPELHRVLDQPRKGDVLVVWKLDRLSRSLRDLLTLMERLGEAGAGFRSLTEAIDTTTPAGRMMMQMVGAFAEFERAMRRERTKVGLDAARGRSHRWSPPEALRSAAIRDSKDDLQGRQDRRRCCSVVQGPPGNRLSATGATQLQEGQPCQIARKVLRQIICKVTGPAILTNFESCIWI